MKDYAKLIEEIKKLVTDHIIDADITITGRPYDSSTAWFARGKKSVSQSIINRIKNFEKENENV